MPLKIQNSTGTAEIVSSSTGGNNRTITLPDANVTLLLTPTASTTNTVTNKIAVVIGGTTYYLLASTSGT